MSRLDHLKALIVALEEAVANFQCEIDCGVDSRAYTNAEAELLRARQALLDAIEKAIR